MTDDAWLLYNLFTRIRTIMLTSTPTVEALPKTSTSVPIFRAHFWYLDFVHILADASIFSQSQAVVGSRRQSQEVTDSSKQPQTHSRRAIASKPNPQDSRQQSSGQHNQQPASDSQPSATSSQQQSASSQQHAATSSEQPTNEARSWQPAARGSQTQPEAERSSQRQPEEAETARRSQK